MSILTWGARRPASSLILVACAATCAGCAGAEAGGASPTAASPAAASVAASVPASVPASPACTGPEHRQMDFWLGEWDVTVRARTSPDSNEWAEAHGSQRVEKILGGCAVAEHFAADGPGQPWAGASYATWDAASKKWRQTWVDDQGGYLLFTGGVDGGAMALYGEPREVKGARFQMRMIWLDVTPSSLRWEWQRRADGATEWVPMLIIRYRRRANG
ncbi:MAG TPA: DUF1579 family protein [Kofleriaceae bacterium]|nr:DUF1579 family protein [Kofleriaceae bacterium]